MCYQELTLSEEQKRLQRRWTISEKVVRSIRANIKKNTGTEKGESNCHAPMVGLLAASVAPWELYEVVVPDAEDAEFAPVKRQSVQKYIARTFSSLITISKTSKDSEDYVVGFAHYTAKEYLLSKETKQGNYTEFYVENIDAHISIAKDVCSSCLQRCDQYRSSHASTDGNCKHCPRKRPLLEYAANNWYRHALKAQEELATTSSPGQQPTGVTEVATTPQKEILRRATLSDRTYARIRFYFLALIGLVSLLLKFALSGQKRLLDSAEGISMSDQDTPEPPNESLTQWAESTKSILDKMSKEGAEPYRNVLKGAAYRGYAKTVELLLATKLPCLGEFLCVA